MELEVNYVIYLCVPKPVPALIFIVSMFEWKCQNVAGRHHSMRNWETRKNVGTRAKYRVLTHSHQTWRAYLSIFAFLFFLLETNTKEAKKTRMLWQGLFFN